jgi:hypothetical protein
MLSNPVMAALLRITVDYPLDGRGWEFHINATVDADPDRTDVFDRERTAYKKAKLCFVRIPVLHRWWPSGRSTLNIE